MTKKEFMLKVIDLLPDREMGWGLKALIQNDQLTPEVFEKLYGIFENGVLTTHKEIQGIELKYKLKEAEIIRDREAQENQKDQLDLDQMLKIV